ncbi:ArnT family glycosyltransferase [Pseudobacter ginsenosidimutans]|uniref:Dolichyl-phosphate-mannose-protein mannosyltransferase n=1 Tax=Pseudobacter ginsenosidimutans TaxID=661488 RepID=A0A4Q7MSE2_9BACT|nr:glycosyltransferase family 39 protein [Pseudobacter ginsenosidimutans]QEC41512.1 glycosyltransferase family 39 protein [Pseudobacter ginsenosidimutans]RZS71705.1 dolichyl-phosphate-mannose-protein mannosyltransferase [Pseudobacter ginsenosidimutans]
MNGLQPSDHKRKTILLIIISSIIRLLLSGIVELNNDEVYYWTYAKELQWNYFDHPPLVGVCIRFFTAGLHWNHEFFIRLASVIGAAISTWLIYLSGKSLSSERTGWIAACLFTASFYSSVIAGLLILPDSPQMVFWMLSVYLIIRIAGSKRSFSININLILLGISIGLCILSKVHGIFCWLGFGGFILFHKRSLLKNPFLYISALITAAMLVPSFLWTISNKMSTVDYHGSRILIRHFQFDSFIRELLGSFAYNNPLNVILLVASLVALKWKLKQYSLILWLGLPLILTVIFLSLFNDTLPHWSGPAYSTLILLTAARLSGINSRKVKKWTTAGISLTAGVLLTAICIINYWPGTLGNKSIPDFGKHDITLDMSGWRNFGKDFSNLYKEDKKSAKDSPRFIFSNYWFPAAHLDFYVARPIGLFVKGIGDINAIHHFAWLNEKLPELKPGEDAYYIGISNFYEPVPEAITKRFSEVSAPVSIPQIRNGKVARYFYVYRLKGYKEMVE